MKGICVSSLRIFGPNLTNFKFKKISAKAEEVPERGVLTTKPVLVKPACHFAWGLKMFTAFSSCQTIIAQVTVIVTGDIRLDLILAAAVLWIRSSRRIFII